MAIKVGDKIPSVTLHYLTPEGMKSVPSEEFFAGKKVAVFGLPGAYTRTCSSRHLPGYVTNADTLKKKGIDAVACVSVNDAFVMDAWGKEHGAPGKVTMLGPAVPPERPGRRCAGMGGWSGARRDLWPCLPGPRGAIVVA